MLEDALRFPLNSDDRVATLLIGGILLLLSVLVLPAFVVQGYLVRVLRASATGDAAAPSFTEWGTLFVDGLKLFVVNLVYGLATVIPFGVALVVLFGGVAALDVDGSGAGVAALGVVGAVLFLLAFLLAVVVSYLLPAAFANFAVEGTVSAAFDLGVMRQVAFSSEYVVAIVLAVVVGGILNVIGGVLAVALVGLPLLFYGQVVTYYLFGRGYAEARAGLEPDVERVAP